MRGALAFFAGFNALFAGQQSYAQELPVFDDEDFEIVSVEPNSRVIVKSDGRDFYCYADANAAAGYILIGGCLPFVNRSETVKADARLAQAIAEANVAATVAAREAAKEAAEVAAMKAALAAKAAKLAAIKTAEEVKLSEVRFAEMFASFDSAKAKDAIVSVARRYQCRFNLESKTISNINLVHALWVEAGFEVGRLYEDHFKEVARKRFNDAMTELVVTGTVEFSDNGSLMILKDCK